MKNLDKNLQKVESLFASIWETLDGRESRENMD